MIPGFKTKKKLGVGIDIGSKLTKIIQLTKGPGSKEQIGFMGYLEANPEEKNYENHLATYLEQHGLKGKQAISSLEDPSLKIRKIELPKMPESDLKEAIKFKMRDVIDGTISDYIIRYSILEAPQVGAKIINYVGYAIKKESVKNLSKLLEKCNLPPSFIEPAIISLSAAVENIYPSENEWVGFADLGVKKSFFGINGKNRFHFSRPLHGISLSHILSPEEYHQKLAVEIQNTLDTFSVTFKIDQLDRIFIVGGGGSVDLANYLSTNLAIKTIFFNPIEELNLSDEQKALAKKTGHLFAHALALARV